MESLKTRVMHRRAELQSELRNLEPESHTAKDIQQALTAVDELITGDLDDMPAVVSAGLSRWLETSRYLGEHHEAKTPALPRLSMSKAAVDAPATETSTETSWGDDAAAEIKDHASS
jgi:hypothetical protein